MKKILMAEDSAFTRQFISKVLREAGHEVTEACDGQDALNRVYQDSFDLLITDLKMPNLDGIELARSVRNLADRQSLPILMLSGEDYESVRPEIDRAGITGWINKPVKLTHLLALVDGLVNEELA